MKREWIEVLHDQINRINEDDDMKTLVRKMSELIKCLAVIDAIQAEEIKLLKKRLRTLEDRPA